MADSVLASSLQRTRLQEFDNIFAGRMDSIDPSVVMVYLIDTVPAAALPYLAEQLDVMGHKGWDLVTTEQERRELIKSAIDLHRYKGTRYAVKRAVQSIGFAGAEIDEGVGLFHNGTITRNGFYSRGAGNWATFKVTLDLGNQKGITAQLGQLLRLLIDEYKPASRVLTSVEFQATLDDEQQEATHEVELAGTMGAIEEQGLPVLLHDGTIKRRDGTFNRSGETDRLFVDVTMSMQEEMPPVAVLRQGIARRNGSILRDGNASVGYGDVGMTITLTRNNGQIEYLYA